MDTNRGYKLERLKIGIDLARYIKGRGPDIASVVDYTKTNKMVLSPRAYAFENYYIITDDSNIVSAAKKMGHSHLHILVVGGKEKALTDIKRIFREYVTETNFGAKEMASTVNQLERMWNRLFVGTSIEDTFYDTFSEAIDIPKEIIVRAIKTREPTGITKEDLSRKIKHLREGRSYVERIDKLSETFCPHCGSVEKLNLTGVDRTIIPHYIQAAVITKVNHLLKNIPFSAREGTLRLIKDGIQRLISQSIRNTHK
jgi:hypothetical protein|tara:strand:- start:8953 stop:9720 length:768 start_codon:yes stop_codon:yes gene_type:complete